MAEQDTFDGHSRSSVRNVVLIVALANLLYFGVEFVVARRIASVSLFADSIDFLEDASLNLLIFFSLAWSALNRARLGSLLAGILLVPAVEFLITAWGKLHLMTAPSPLQLSMTGLGALAVNFGCAFLLARVRHRGGSLTHAAFLSSRNDVAANVAILLASAVSVFWRSAWPDLLVGVVILGMNADAARKVWRTAHRERGLAGQRAS